MRTFEWPPWGGVAMKGEISGRLYITCVDTQGFHLGMRVHIDDASMSLFARAWRWLTKRNWRVVGIEDDVVTLERSR